MTEWDPSEGVYHGHENKKTMSAAICTLYVDDDADVAETTASPLERENDHIEMVIETSAADALDRLANTSIDCIVSAYQLPDMDGLKLLETVRDEYSDLPFILFTDAGSEKLASEAISGGVTDYLSKEYITEPRVALVDRIENAVEQYQTHQAMERERTHRSALFVNTPDPIVEISFDGTTPLIEHVNPAFEDVFGFNRGNVVGQSVTEVLVPDSEREEHLSLRDTVAQGEPVETEVHRQTVDGIRIFRLRVIPIEGADAPDSAYAWYTDITERKQYENRLEGLNEGSQRLMAATSEAAVADITIEVTQQVLEQPLTAMWSYDADEERLVPLAAADAAANLDETQEAADAIGAIPAGTTEMHVFREGEIEVIDDYGAIDEPAHPENPLGTLLVAPLGEYGQLHVGSTTVDEFDATTQDLIEVLAQMAEAALERVHREQALSALHDITRDLMEAVSAQEIATIVVEAGDEILDLPLAHVYLMADDEETLQPIAMTEKMREQVGELPQFQRGEGMFWKALEAGETELYDDVQAESELASDLPFRGAIIAPLGDHGVFGSASLEPEDFDAFDREFAAILASQAETALDRAKREEALRDREDKLRQARDRFQKIFDHSNDAIVIFDPEADAILEANPEATKLLGYSREELLSLGPSDIHPDEMEQFREFVETIQTEDGGWTDELTCLTETGDRVPAEISASTIEFNGHESVLALIRDVSDLRAYERELERQNERLEEFAGVISHDLRNPLNVATGRVKMAQDDCDSEHLDDVQSALNRMDTMIDDLLTLARARQTVEDPAPVDLASMVEGCWRNVDTADAELISEIDCTIHADESRLQHVFENLFRNAVEHGSRSVTIRVGDFENREGFFIEDDGPGISEEERKRVFDFGYSTTEDGAGFGLSIVEEIIEAHGWDITVTDGIDGGARFEIRGIEPEA